jgi:acetyl-CoA carboxylase carboxyl transferase subunit alpha
MAGNGLEFEKPIFELEKKIEELKKFTSSENIDLRSEINRLQEKLDRSLKTLHPGRGFS